MERFDHLGNPLNIGDFVYYLSGCERVLSRIICLGCDHPRCYNDFLDIQFIETDKKIGNIHKAHGIKTDCWFVHLDCLELAMMKTDVGNPHKLQIAAL